MNALLQNAASLLETAENVVRAGHTAGSMSILIGSGGAVRMIADSDWSLRSLQQEHGALSAYRVNTRGDVVEVEAMHAGRSCRLKSETPARAARMLLGAGIQWRAAASRQLAICASQS